MKNIYKPHYNKQDINEILKFYDPPTTSSQDIIGQRTYCISKNNQNNKYIFEKKLNDGSSCVIHLGKNKDNNEKVVIKEISKRHNWRKELNILKKLSESETGRILKYIDYFETHMNSYIVTKYYEGYDLFEHIDINVPYPEKEAYELFNEMCQCIKECHDNNIVHLDIKCENYMVKKENLFPIKQGNLILIDFGHSEKIKENTDIDDIQIGSEHGTKYYLSPEGYDKVYSSKSDIWSLGICFCLLITGDYPYSGSEREYMWNAINSNIKLRGNISKRSKMIIELCLKPDPRERPTINQLINFVSASNNNNNK